jgi:predicted DNA-binding transcriptional regulator YafY
MPHIKNALIRFRIIDRMLRNQYKPFPSKGDLREACEEALYGGSFGDNICDSTIEKDMFAMKMDHDAPIKYSKRHGGYYYLEPDFSINDIPLSEDELSSIRFAIKTLQQFREVPFFQEFGNAIDKIVDRVAVGSDPNNDMNQYIGFESSVSIGGNEFLPQLLKAIREKELVLFNYQSFISGLAKQRKGMPLYLKEYRNRWYILLFDLEKKDIITYGLDRMSDLEVLDESFTLPLEFDPQVYFQDAIGITAFKGSAEKISLKANKIAQRYIDSQPFHPSQRLVNQTQTHGIFELKILISEEFIRLLLSYGGEVEVIEPAHLRKTIEERIKYHIEIYSSLKK